MVSEKAITTYSNPSRPWCPLCEPSSYECRWNQSKGENFPRLCRFGDASGLARFGCAFFSLLPVSFASEDGSMTVVDQIHTRPSSPTAATHLLFGDHPTDQTGLSVLSSAIRRFPLGNSIVLTWPSSPHETSQSPFDDHATRLAPPTPEGYS